MYFLFCCSIFKDRCRSLSACTSEVRRSFILPHLLRFVKRFCKTFFDFSSNRCPALEATRLLYHIRFLLSRPFFKFFKKFRGSLSQGAYPPAERSIIIAPRRTKVKHFRQKNFIFTFSPILPRFSAKNAQYCTIRFRGKEKSFSFLLIFLSRNGIISSATLPS